MDKDIFVNRLLAANASEINPSPSPHRLSTLNHRLLTGFFTKMREMTPGMQFCKGFQAFFNLWINMLQKNDVYLCRIVLFCVDNHSFQQQWPFFSVNMK
jgi:hypothetical protein